ncbi:MAG: carbohydrate-binding family 9-like protein [Clostridia bacterium]|nr:carbohydrate-binding family 9-like protein [Clostridia bacterium]MBQ7053062.1 carbohydrate-binding family 9-like protein [Clostridia bacterium]
MEYVVRKVASVNWDEIEAVELVHQPWLVPCAVGAKAQACHDGEKLYVRMEAEEENIRATLTGPLDQVCNDSCLEFFFAPKADDKRYFNFELNPLCNAYVGFGAERKTRVRQILKNPQATLNAKSYRTEKGWGIEYEIPAAYIRLYMPEFELAGEAACNFYKCGDETEIPHYLAWAPLSSEKPDYHRRQDFGRMIFE